MKKFLSIILGLSISSMLGMTVSLVSAGTIGDLMDEIFEEAGVNDVYDLDQDELEGLSENEEPFANLYLFTYKNVVDGPKDAALKEVALRTKYKEKDLEDIIFNGDTQPIIEKFNADTAMAAAEDTVAQQEADQAETDDEFESMIESSGLEGYDRDLAQYIYDTYYKPEVTDAEELAAVLTQEYVLEEYTYLSDLYEKEYDFQTENKKLAYEALANEMFMDGDTENSAGIDLISDLDYINRAIFGYELVIESRDDVVLASEEESEKADVMAYTEPEPEIVLAAEDDGEEPEEEEDNPYTCFEDEELRAALDEYAETGGPSATYPTSMPVDGSEATGGDDGDYADDSEETDDEIDTREEFQDLLDSLSAVPGNWTRSLPCNDIFCITVNLVTENNDPAVNAEYEDTDSCIACHTAYINQNLKDTLSKSLVPSKVSMNWFEDATCKEAGFLAQLDLNVYTVPQPITLDPEDDTDDLAQERAENLQEALESAESRYGTKTRADIECEAIINMYDHSSQTEFEEAMSACEMAANNIENDIAALTEDFIFESQTQVTDTLYEQFSAELGTLLTYFESFDEGLTKTADPIASIIAKPYCQ